MKAMSTVVLRAVTWIHFQFNGARVQPVVVVVNRCCRRHARPST